MRTIEVACDKCGLIHAFDTEKLLFFGRTLMPTSPQTGWMTQLVIHCSVCHNDINVTDVILMLRRTS